MKVYIVGAVTGHKDWRDKFIAAKNRMEVRGYIVLTPMDYPDGLNTREYMQLSVANVFLADLILVLPGYEDSVGTNTEIVLARNINTLVEFDKEQYGEQGSIEGTPADWRNRFESIGSGKARPD